MRIKRHNHFVWLAVVAYILLPNTIWAHPGHDHSDWASDIIHLMPFLTFSLLSSIVLFKLNRLRQQSKKRDF